MKGLVILLAIIISSNLMAQEIFQLKKSRRIKNVLHFKANVEACKFKTPAVTNHWIMGEEDGHVEGLSSAEKPYFTPKITYVKETDASFTMGAIEKLGGRLESKEIAVRLEKCKPMAFIQYQGQEILVKEVFVNVNLLMYPTDVTIKGSKADGTAVAIKLN